MTSPTTPFHIALNVRDIDEAKTFYAGLLGCELGRSADEWIDFDLFGHQLVCHLDRSIGKQGRLKPLLFPKHGHGIPVPHYGVIIELDDWLALSKSLTGKVEFILSPTVRLEDESGEQATMLFYDPSGNALEFKSFKDVETQLFAD
jgi:extradiol dioxygenase family protein